MNYDVIGLLYTRRCPFTCADCITESSPTAKGRMKLGQALSYLPAIARFTNTICFTGGEPFLYFKDILTLTSESRSLGLDVTVVTGAGWVRTEKGAAARLEALARAGVSTICISWDRYHEEFSNIDRAVLLAKLAVESKINVKVRSVIPCGETSKPQHDAFDGIPIDFQSVLPIPLGRGSKLPDSHFARDSEPPRGVCSVVQSPSIDHDGTVYACCGPSLYSAPSSPLVLGNANNEPLENIFARAQASQILHLLRDLGSFGFHLLLKDLPLAAELRKKRPQGYATICELCIDVTNDDMLVAAVENRMRDPEMRMLVAAARLWREKKLLSKAGSQRNIGSTFNLQKEEMSHAV